MRLSLCIALVSIVVAGGCALVPTHEIPVREAYILAGVHVDDWVEITMKDGERHKFAVTSVGPNGIGSAEATIPFEDIDRLVKLSWFEPEHPCGGGDPVGCSVPIIFRFSPEFGQVTDRMEPACDTHDYCYRHGFATYGRTRDECDLAFFEDMSEVCARGYMGAKGYLECLVARVGIYEAVRKYGDDGFRRETSTYCEYDLYADPAPRGIESHVVGGPLQDRPVGPGPEADQ